MFHRSSFRIVLLVFALAGFAVFSAMRVEFDTDPLNLLPDDLPEVNGLRLYQQKFGQSIDLILTVEGDDPFTVEEAASSLTDALYAEKSIVARVDWQPPGMDDLSVYGDLLAYAWLNTPDADFQKLTERLTNPQTSAARFESAVETLSSSLEAEDLLRASQDPLGLIDLPAGDLPLRSNDNDRLSFASSDSCFRLIFAAAPLDLYEDKDTTLWLKNVEETIDQWKKDQPDLAGAVILNQTGRAPYINEVATAMRAEMRMSIIITISVISALFWFFHRRLLPLICLILSLALTFFITLSIGSVLYEKLGAGAVGFAAILIGLVVDYGFILYEEAKHTGTAHLRKRMLHSITWASVTTAAVFIGLNLSGLPGACQLGTLVGIGIAAGCLVMMGPFVWLISLTKPATTPSVRVPVGDLPPRWIATITLVICGIILAIKGVPSVTPSAEALRPKNSHTLNVIRNAMEKLGTNEKAKMRVIAAGDSPEQLRANVIAIRQAFEKAAPEGSRFEFPQILLPGSPNQATKRAQLAAITEVEPRLLQQAEEAGFTTDALALTQSVLKSWRGFLQSDSSTFYPSSEASRWILDKIISKDSQPLCALGYIELPPGTSDDISTAVAVALGENGGNPAGWDYLRPAILGLIQKEFYSVVLPMIAILLVMLFLAFRDLQGVILSVATVTVSSVALLAIMRLAGFDWNLVNLAGVPLLLGAGLDYSIHMQLALRRCERNEAGATRRALLLCGISTATGFGTLISSSNAGVASLGWICAIGLLLNMLVAVFLLPSWWHRFTDPPVAGN